MTDQACPRNCGGGRVVHGHPLAHMWWCDELTALTAERDRLRRDIDIRARAAKAQHGRTNELHRRVTDLIVERDAANDRAQFWMDVSAHYQSRGRPPPMPPTDDLPAQLRQLADMEQTWANLASPRAMRAAADRIEADARTIATLRQNVSTWMDKWASMRDAYGEDRVAALTAAVRQHRRETIAAVTAMARAQPDGGHDVNLRDWIPVTQWELWAVLEATTDG